MREPVAAYASTSAAAVSAAGGGATATAAPPTLVPPATRVPGAVRESYRDIKAKLQERIVQDLDPKLDLTDQIGVRREIEEAFNKAVEAEAISVSRTERKRLLDEITDEIIGLGPLEPLLVDDSITEVMVNGPDQVYIERNGRLELSDISFRNDDHVMRIIDRIIAPIGRRIDESSPMVDARLVDGSRINAIIPPISLVGPVLTIRKFASSPLTTDDLIRFGTRHRRCSISCAPASRPD